MITPKEIIEQSQSIVNGDRQSDYGHPKDNHACTAAMWSAYLKRIGQRELTANDVCMLNILQKVSREANLHKDDTFLDIVGYTLNAAMCGEESTTQSINPLIMQKIFLSDDPEDKQCFYCKHRSTPSANHPCCECMESSTHKLWEPK